MYKKMIITRNREQIVPWAKCHDALSHVLKKYGLFLEDRIPLLIANARNRKIAFVITKDEEVLKNMLNYGEVYLFYNGGYSVEYDRSTPTLPDNLNILSPTDWKHVCTVNDISIYYARKYRSQNLLQRTWFNFRLNIQRLYWKFNPQHALYQDKA